MATLTAIRERKRDAKLAQLHQGARSIVASHPEGQVWLDAPEWRAIGRDATPLAG